MSLSMSLTSYAFFLAVVPVLVQWHYFRQTLLTALSVATGLHDVPADFVTIGLGLTAIYTFVIAGFIADVAETISEKYRRAFSGLSPGVDQLKQQFPGYAVSAYLLQSNTNLHYAQGKAFLFLQSILLVLVPFTQRYPQIQKANGIAYRCALGWTLVYSLFPRETMHFLWLVSQVIQQQFAYQPRYSEDYVL
ncbi:hypothetical protein BJV82DRAFT_88677 [Fennellomyces sp. T-0311]|nr:hypothetical protein BJV82DRAFT_88677 [Fennellomyces sp. T-0311]